MVAANNCGPCAPNRAGTGLRFTSLRLARMFAANAHYFRQKGTAMYRPILVPLAALLLVTGLPAAPAAAQETGVFLDGAEPWVASDCAGDIPIVVGSDAKAQSDIYSAVALAGVLDTDCIVLAGPRDAGMTADQQARLDAAVAGGYVLGGTAAVPDAKIAGRGMKRLGGVDRWATARLIGSEARTLAADASAAGETETPVEIASSSFSAVSAGYGHSCGVRSDGTVTCWGSGHNAPRGSFTAVSAGDGHSCGLRMDGTVTCWSWNLNGQADAPSGSFTAVSAGSRHSCGLRSDGTATCWGDDEFGQASAPPGSFASVSAGEVHSCGLRTDATVTCWGRHGSEYTDPPSDSFTAVSAGGGHACGLRVDGTVTCWGWNLNRQAAAPSGSFTAVSAGGGHSCGVRSDGTVTCWGGEGHSRSRHSG